MSAAPAPFPRPLEIALLYGGPSAEREVSLESGREIGAALLRKGHRVTAIDPGEEAVETEAFLRLAEWRRFDVAFLALHGTFGEDGTVQRLLDSVGVPYTGSDARASALAFSKSAAKARFAAEGVATAAYAIVRRGDPMSRTARDAAAVGFPLVVKPDAQGSSLGVSVVRSPSELAAALERCFALGPSGLIERFIPGAEWTVGFLGDEPLPPMCVSTPREFLDFDAKYRDESTTVSFGGEGSPEVSGRVTAVAAAARRALGVTVVCRVDLRVDPGGTPWVLEVNTLPGFTPHSAVPTAAARIGLGFDDLCERVITLAFAERAARRAA